MLVVERRRNDTEPELISAAIPLMNQEQNILVTLPAMPEKETHTKILELTQG